MASLVLLSYREINTFDAITEIDVTPLGAVCIGLGRLRWGMQRFSTRARQKGIGLCSVGDDASMGTVFLRRGVTAGVFGRRGRCARSG